jgi:hypothetical protein
LAPVSMSPFAKPDEFLEKQTPYTDRGTESESQKDATFTGSFVITIVQLLSIQKVSKSNGNPRLAPRRIPLP